MNTANIDNTAPPGKKRYTAHIIQNGEMFPSDCVLGSSFQITENAQFPPDILVNTVYAGFVLLHFGTESMKDSIRTWKDTYSSNSTHREVAYGAITDECTTTTESCFPSVASTLQGTEGDYIPQLPLLYKADDLIGMVMAILYILVLPDEHLEMMRHAREGAEAAEQRHVQEKVEEWIGHVDAA
ncbi:hypothetical protein EDB85DRAFT_1887295 [Lactarius pseudohatsudake]|nr:hypothetical protein EDB85DRAFT_1887295 [Lactarius pseudohatsudake]